MSGCKPHKSDVNVRTRMCVCLASEASSRSAEPRFPSRCLRGSRLTSVCLTCSLIACTEAAGGCSSNYVCPPPPQLLAEEENRSPGSSWSRAVRSRSLPVSSVLRVFTFPRTTENPNFSYLTHACFCRRRGSDGAAVLSDGDPGEHRVSWWSWQSCR